MYDAWSAICLCVYDRHRIIIADILVYLLNRSFDNNSILVAQLIEQWRSFDHLRLLVLNRKILNSVALAFGYCDFLCMLLDYSGRRRTIGYNLLRGVLSDLGELFEDLCLGLSLCANWKLSDGRTNDPWTHKHSAVGLVSCWALGTNSYVLWRRLRLYLYFFLNFMMLNLYWQLRLPTNMPKLCSFMALPTQTSPQLSTSTSPQLIYSLHHLVWNHLRRLTVSRNRRPSFSRGWPSLLERWEIGCRGGCRCLLVGHLRVLGNLNRQLCLFVNHWCDNLHPIRRVICRINFWCSCYNDLHGSWFPLDWIDKNSTISQIWIAGRFSNQLNRIAIQLINLWLVQYLRLEKLAIRWDNLRLTLDKLWDSRL